MIWRIVRASNGPPLRTTPTVPAVPRVTLTPETATMRARQSSAAVKLAIRRNARLRITMSAHGGGPLRPPERFVSKLIWTEPCRGIGMSRDGANGTFDFGGLFRRSLAMGYLRACGLRMSPRLASVWACYDPEP
jgi:hypothetical protein